MASKTSNLGLTRPSYTDAVDVAILNYNWALVDEAIGEQEKRIKALESQGGSGTGGSGGSSGGSSGSGGSTAPIDSTNIATKDELLAYLGIGSSSSGGTSSGGSTPSPNPEPTPTPTPAQNDVATDEDVFEFLGL